METGNKINIWWLFMGGSVLISAGWFMKPFPVFIFFGLAPFFAILDHTIESDNFWENSELILIGMAVYFFSAYQFDSSHFMAVMLQAILFTLPFLAFSFAYENLGPRTGKFTIVIFWLALEFVILLMGWPDQPIYLADAFQATGSWLRWNNETGYLGASAWILISNWIFYTGTLKGKFNWLLISLGLVIAIGPVIYSVKHGEAPILREDMIELYRHHPVSHTEYQIKGELVARTCAWLSPLIILFALVKSKINKS